MNRIVITGVIGFSVAALTAILFNLIPGMGGTGFILPAVLGGFAGFFYMATSGNKKVVKVSAGERAQALNAPPPDGKAVVWVYREGFVGKAVGLNVSIDGQDVAQLKSPASTRLELSPGRHTLGASLKVSAALDPNSGSADLDLQAGQTVVFKLTMKMGALKNTLVLEPQGDVAGVLQKLSGTPMVAPLVATA